MDDQSIDAGDSTSGDDAVSDGGLSLTTAFELLAKEPRRRLLYWLHRREEGTVSVDDLARRLDEGDADHGGSGPAGARVALHHVHLPALAEAGVVEYDADGGTVRYRGDPRLHDLLEWGRREEPLD